MQLAPLRWDHRTSLHALLDATNAFSAEEINVALELFDEANAGPCHPAGAKRLSGDTIRPLEFSVGGESLPTRAQRVRDDKTGAQRVRDDNIGAQRVRDDNIGAQRARDDSEGPAFASTPDYEFIGAFADDESLLGYACFGATPSTSGTWDLYWLAVHPAAQGQGTGRALVRQVERELQSRDARLLVVETSSRNEYSHTREFYARGGYVEVARVRDFYAPADDRIILTTRLTARERGVATR